MDWQTTLSDSTLRLSIFLAVFALMAAAEWLAPKRRLTLPRAMRWPTNLSIVVLDSVLVRALASLAVPISAIVAAAAAERNGWGLLNQFHWPAAIEFAIALVALDFAIWVQHFAAHRVPLLWRLHRMHHADRDIDVTTAIRFHPIEIGLSMLWKVTCVVALGAEPAAVLAFEILLNGLAMFNHANVALPRWLDRVMRLAVVTPDMHRVHHSVLAHEHDSNYGFNLSIWDRVFGTYTDEPENDHDGMTIGLAEYQSNDPARLRWSLLLPFRRE